MTLSDEAAQLCLESKRAIERVPLLEASAAYDQALFWSGVAVERALRAHVVHVSKANTAFVHDLHKLAEIANMPLIAKERLLCRVLTQAIRQVRYPRPGDTWPDPAKARRAVRAARRMQQWLVAKLEDDEPTPPR